MLFYRQTFDVCLGLSSSSAIQRPVNPCECLLPTKESNALEDTWRHGRAGDRDPHGLEDLARLLPGALDDCAQGCLDVLQGERLGPGQGLARGLQRLDPSVASDDLVERPVIVGGPVEHESRQRPEVAERLDLLRRDPDSGAEPRPARELLQAPGQFVEPQLMQVTPVGMPELALVEDRWIL